MIAVCKWILLSLLAMGGTSGCATLPDGPGWGRQATLTPGWARIRESAVHVARDAHVWAPLAGAVVLQIGDADREISDWARRETPLFGSARNAERWSDDLRTASSVAYVATVLLTPSGDEDEWFVNKAKGFAVGLGARAATSLVTQGLKEGVGRERPHGADRLSFPSGHASASAVNTRLASRNLRWMPISDSTRRVLDVGLLSLTVGTSWARIESGAHYPSDTLFGMALGNFLGALVNDAFLGDTGDARSGVTVNATPGGAELRVHVAF